jgi:hypothetical protein
VIGDIAAGRLCGRKKVTQILSDLLRFAQTKNTSWWEKAGKGGEKRESLGSGDGTSDEAWNYLPGQQLPLPSPPF